MCRVIGHSCQGPGWRTQGLRPPEPHAWIGISRGIDVRPLTLSLSPSDGERVPFRAGEGSSAGPPGFHGSACLSLGRFSTLPGLLALPASEARREGWGRGAQARWQAMGGAASSVTASSPQPSPPEEEREIESSAGGSVKRLKVSPTRAECPARRGATGCVSNRVESSVHPQPRRCRSASAPPFLP